VKAIIDFIVERGFALMIFGFCAAIAGVLAYALINTPRYAATPYPTLAVALAFLGFIVYLTGRVSVAAQRRRARRRLPEDLDDADAGGGE
jgi:hypothetical protein